MQLGAVVYLILELAGAVSLRTEPYDARSSPEHVHTKHSGAERALVGRVLHNLVTAQAPVFQQALQHQLVAQTVLRTYVYHEPAPPPPPSPS
jgi:hypothetical protein